MSTGEKEKQKYITYLDKTIIEIILLDFKTSNIRLLLKIKGNKTRQFHSYDYC